MRRHSRELALQILFQVEFSPSLSVEKILEMNEKPIDYETKHYALQLYEGVQENRESIDATITSASQHWKLDRMPMVDRNLMRIAVFEMLYMKNPIKSHIAINEAIDLAKQFGTTESGGFVNGVLDQIAKAKGL